MRSTAAGGATKNQRGQANPRAGQSSNGIGNNNKTTQNHHNATATNAITINNNKRKNNNGSSSSSNATASPSTSPSPTSSSSSSSYASKLSSSGSGSPNRRQPTSPAATSANKVTTAAAAAAATGQAQPHEVVEQQQEEDVREWLHAKLESTFGLDASVYGSYLEGFLQTEPSSGSASDDDGARDAIREVLLAAALDQEGVVEEFIEQLMRRWANRPKGAAAERRATPTTSSSAPQVAAGQPSTAKQTASSRRKTTKPQAIAPPKVPPSAGAIGQSARGRSASTSAAPAEADVSSYPAGYFGVSNLTADDDELVNDEREDDEEEMRRHTESMVSALLGDDLGLGMGGDPDGMMVGGLSLDDDDDDAYDAGEFNGGGGGGHYYGGFASPAGGFLGFGSGGGGGGMGSSSPVQFVDFAPSPSLSLSSSFSSPPRSPSPSSSPSSISSSSAKDEAFEMLVSMFNDYEREGLQQLFDANDRDMERTVAILLEIEREEADTNPGTAASAASAAATAHGARGPQAGAAVGGPASGAAAKGGLGPVDAKHPMQKMPADVVAPPNANNIVCRYYLKGKCFRADCWYSHDLRAVTCKYWMAGECLKGDICEFRHGYDPQQLQSRTQKVTTDYATSFPSLPSSSPTPAASAAAFPSLYAAHHHHHPQPQHQHSRNVAAAKPTFLTFSDVGAPPPHAGGGGGDAMNMAQRLKLQKLQEEFQDLVEEETVRDVFVREAGLGYETAKARLLARHPDLAARKQERDRERERERARQQSRQASQAVQEKKLTEIIRGLKKKNKVGWVETGESVGEQYSALRERAIEHARVRNKLFQEATQAYLVGNKSTATQLSAQGRLHQKKMEELHEQACQQIFQSRNSSHPDVLDLHGLHVDEALSILETFLLKQARELVDGPPQSQSQSSRAQHKSAVATATGLYNGSFSSATATSSALSASSGSGSSGGGGGGKGTHAGFKLVYVITGTGHHSQSKKARLQPAVQKFLAERGYASVDTSPDGRGGMLTVTIKP